MEYKSNGGRNKTLSLEEYLNEISPYLKDITNNFKQSDTWEIQLTISNSFISSIDNDEEGVMHSKIDNTKIMINDEADEIIKEVFDSFKSYIDSPDCIKNKKATINPINKKDNKCFQYAVKIALNHEEIKKDPQ